MQRTDINLAQESKEVNSSEGRLSCSLNLSLDQQSLNSSFEEESKINKNLLSVSMKQVGLSYNPDMPKIKEIGMMTGP